MSIREKEAIHALRRHQMVDAQLRTKGISDDNVLHAMERVPRHAFVPNSLRGMAYNDGPLPIGDGQTISQPYIVALMTEALGIGPGQRVLEVGTGSGYQTAVLACMDTTVYTVECVENLAHRARTLLEKLGYDNIHYRVGDGREGWPEEAPFDGIIVTAAPETQPPGLTDQLAIGGRLVIPLGHWEQNLVVLTKMASGTLSFERLCAVRFVPLV